MASIPQVPLDDGTNQDEDAQVIEWLKPVFPQLTSQVLRTSVLHPSNRQGEYDKARLLQRCIDDLLELRTYKMSVSDENDMDNSSVVEEEIDQSVIIEGEEHAHFFSPNVLRPANDSNKGTDSQPISIGDDDEVETGRGQLPLPDLLPADDIKIVSPKDRMKQLQEQIKEVCEIFQDIEPSYVEKYLISYKKQKDPVEAMIEFLFDRKGLYPKCVTTNFIEIVPSDSPARDDSDRPVYTQKMLTPSKYRITPTKDIDFNTDESSLDSEVEHALNDYELHHIVDDLNKCISDSEVVVATEEVYNLINSSRSDSVSDSEMINNSIVKGNEMFPTVKNIKRHSSNPDSEVEEDHHSSTDEEHEDDSDDGLPDIKLKTSCVGRNVKKENNKSNSETAEAPPSVIQNTDNVIHTPASVKSSLKGQNIATPGPICEASSSASGSNIKVVKTTLVETLDSSSASRNSSKTTNATSGSTVKVVEAASKINSSVIPEKSCASVVNDASTSTLNMPHKSDVSNTEKKINKTSVKRNSPQLGIKDLGKPIASSSSSTADKAGRKVKAFPESTSETLALIKPLLMDTSNLLDIISKKSKLVSLLPPTLKPAALGSATAGAMPTYQGTVTTISQGNLSANVASSSKGIKRRMSNETPPKQQAEGEDMDSLVIFRPPELPSKNIENSAIVPVSMAVQTGPKDIYLLDDIDITEQMNIYEQIRKGRGSADNIVPVQEKEVIPQIPVVKTQLEIMTDEVCLLFPNVDPKFVVEKLNSCTAENKVERVVDWILAMKSYPKKNDPVTKKKSESEQQSGTSQMGESNNNKVKWDGVTDYYKDFKSKVDHVYCDQCLKLLEMEFRKLPMRDIRNLMACYNNHYSPTRLLIVKTFKENGISVDEIPNPMSPLQASSSDISSPLPENASTVLSFDWNDLRPYKVKLLKCGRAKRTYAFQRTPELLRELDFIINKSKIEKEEKDRLVALTVNESEYQESGQSIECGCCYGEYPFENMVQCYEGHLFCKDCLQGYAKEAVFGGGKVTLECMSDGCEATYPKSQLQKSLPSNVLEKYEDRCQEEAINLAEMDDLVRCPHCDFAALMDPGDKVFKCHNEKCLKETCRYCKESWEEHFGIPCSEIEKKDETKLRLQFEEKMTMAKIRTCPRCKASFTKIDGCNKMTCRCGAKMCYICRKPNIDYNHFCRHVRDPGHPCSTCKDCSLWTNPDEDDDRAVAEIKKSAQEERKAQGYEGDKDIGVPEQFEPKAKKQKLNPK